MGYNIWVGSYGKKIDKLRKMVWSQFSNILLKITILDIDDWGRIRVDIPKKIRF